MDNNATSRDANIERSKQTMSDSDREEYINRARGLREYASRTEQETSQMTNIQDMVKFLADKIISIEEKIGGSGDSFASRQEAQNPLNAPVEVTGAQPQQANPLDALAGLAMGNNNANANANPNAN
ncbi:MAG: hypothetical protein KAH32_07380 [Chlamydiia bacterium]|nr:hypothetical protein [Chlamydiia bacterium]